MTFLLDPKQLPFFKNLVNNFSVGQIYNIIYRAIANSTEQYQSGKITKIMLKTWLSLHVKVKVKELSLTTGILQLTQELKTYHSLK